MNINHITFSPEVSTLCLYFHGCNFKCKARIRKKTLKDVHLHKISKIKNKNINLEEVINKIRALKPKKIIFLGGEPSIDPELSNLLAESKALDCYNVVLNNGFRLHKDFTGKSNKTVLKNFIKAYISEIKFRASVDENPFRIDGYVKVSDLYRKPSPEEVGNVAVIARTYLRNVSCLRGDDKVCYEVVEIL